MTEFIPQSELQRRFRAGDGVDWPQLYYQGVIDEHTLTAKTGFTPEDLAVVCIPRNAPRHIESH